MKLKKALVTGAAGFIGSSIALQLLSQGYQIVGLDNLTPNYPLKFKKENLNRIKSSRFHYIQADVRNRNKLMQIFKSQSFNAVIHLAALTGVRASLLNPGDYHEVNMLGTKILYELSAQHDVSQFVFSSSSSVYGIGNGLASVENQRRDPRSPYALSKKNAEDVLKKLHSKYRMSTVIFRLFSVYGPYGRPDMAPYIFTKKAFSNSAITIYGEGTAARDFTNIADVVRAFERVLTKKFDFEVFNIGNTHPIKVNTLIQLTQKYTNQNLKLTHTNSLSAEASITFANIEKANKMLHWRPMIDFEHGFESFIKWYSTHRL